MRIENYLFDWGDTLMVDDPRAEGPMATWPSVRIVPGAAAALEALSAVARCHLATNARDSTAVEIRAALERVGLSRYITNVFCYREVGAEKPSRAFYTRILEILDCDPRDVLMIGDDLQKDVIGALDCGIQGILFNPTGAAVPPGIRAVSSLLELVPGESPPRPRLRGA